MDPCAEGFQRRELPKCHRISETRKLREVKRLGQYHTAGGGEAGTSCGMFWGPWFLQLPPPPTILFFAQSS